MSADNRYSDYWCSVVEKIARQASQEARELTCDEVWFPLFLQIKRQVYERVADQVREHLDWRRGRDT